MFGKKKRKSKNSSPGFFRRLVRGTVSIIVLSALILGISLATKELSNFNVSKLAFWAGRFGVDEEQVGEVAGNFAKRVSDTDLGLIEEFSKDTSAQNEAVTQENIIASKSNRSENDVDAESQVESSQGDIVLRIAVFADSHSDIANLTKAIKLAEENDVSAIFHLGDHTNLGVTSYLEEAKNTLDTASVPYYAIPGDRDLWQSVGPANFKNVFGENFHVVTLSGYKFLVLDNSANNSVIPSNLVNLFTAELNTADFVLLSQPLYHPTNNKVMGITDGEDVALVKQQATEILDIVRNSDVKAVIAAEHHISSENTDPVKNGLRHIVVGAVTSTINDRPQRILQSPRFSILNVDDNGNFNIEQIIL